MTRQLKLMILANILLGISFVAANFVYLYFASLRPTTIVWSPLWLTYYNPHATVTIGDLGSPEPNFSFYFFWALLLVNIYFLIKLEKKSIVD